MLEIVRKYKYDVRKRIVGHSRNLINMNTFWENTVDPCVEHDNSLYQSGDIAFNRIAKI